MGAANIKLLEQFPAPPNCPRLYAVGLFAERVIIGLTAAKQLGWSHIDCIEIDDDAVTAEQDA